MKRKLLVPSAAYFAAMFLLAKGLGLAAALGTGLTVFVFALVFIKDRRKTAITGLCFFLAGAAVFSGYRLIFADRAEALDGKEIDVHGKVTELKYLGSDKLLVTVDGDCGGVSARLSFICENSDVDYGDRIKARVEVSKIMDTLKGTSADWYRSEGMYIRGGEAASFEKTKEMPDYPLKWSMHLRDSLCKKMLGGIGGEEGAFAAAMICGDKSWLSDATERNVYRSGIGHIFSVSGTHVVLIFTMLSGFISLLVRSKKLRMAILLCIIWFFSAAAGLSPSVVRASFLLTVMVSGELIHRRTDRLNALCFSSLVMLTFSPYAVTSVSFLLSYSAVFALVTAAPFAMGFVKAGGVKRDILHGLIASFSILIVTMPIQLMYFDEISVIAPVSNLILVPLCTLALGFCVAAAAFGWAAIICTPFLMFAKVLLRLVFIGARMFSSLQLAYIPAGVPAVRIAILLSLAAALAAVIIRPKARVIAASAVGAVFVWVSVSAVWFCRPGDEKKLLILPNGTTMQCLLYQGKDGVLFDIGSGGRLNKAVSRYEQRMGVRCISCAFISRRDQAAADRMKAELAFVPESFCFEHDEGTKIVLGDLTVTVLEKGYKLETDGREMTLTGKTIEYSGKTFDTTKVKNALILDLDSMELSDG